MFRAFPGSEKVRIPKQRLRIPEGVVEIDGSFGEGGGQIVRTACALAALSGLTCRVRQIRAGRSHPGLRAQHCATIRGLARLCRAETSPLAEGTQEVFFSPRSGIKGDLELDTGTAGSVALVLQGILLAALGSSAREVKLLLRGGTDVPGAPSCDYLRRVKSEWLRRMGYTIDLRIVRRGYYPRGGGIIEATLRPPEGKLLLPLRVTESTEALAAGGISHASHALASRRVAERQAKAAAKVITQYLHVPARIEVEYGTTSSPGSGLMLWASTEQTIWGGGALGRPTVSSEQVADQASERLLKTYHCRAALDPWLGDQILPYLALAGASSVVSVPVLTRHMRTNMWVIQQFLNVRFFCEPQEDRVLVHCGPRDE